MSKVVRKTLADSPMTSARKRKLAQVAARPDSEIDLSEIFGAWEKWTSNAWMDRPLLGTGLGNAPRKEREFR
jgi:hypothetical protein